MAFMMTEGHITPLCIDSVINLEKDHFGAVENVLEQRGQCLSFKNSIVAVGMSLFIKMKKF